MSTWNLHDSAIDDPEYNDDDLDDPAKVANTAADDHPAGDGEIAACHDGNSADSTSAPYSAHDDSELDPADDATAIPES